jgi:hypothetical protein
VCTILYGRTTTGGWVRVGDHDTPESTREYLRDLGCVPIRREDSEDPYEYWNQPEYGWGYRFFR